VKFFLLLLTCVACFCTTTFAQSRKLSGKIVNAKNEPLSSVSVSIDGVTKGVSDVEGRFTIALPTDSSKITFTAVGYATNTTRPPGNNELLVVLEEERKQLQTVTIKAASPRKESVNAMISYQKNTNTVAQVISAEAIRRSPDKNTGEILKRVPGTSIQDGKYLVVRGLSDRYNTAMLNGIQLSSTEPDRKTFSFDIFPAAMIDNLIINKAFVPEMPGEFAGGLVQVNTKDIPGSSFLNIQLGTGFNTNTIGKPFYSYSGGKLDFIGMDDGSRALAKDFPNKSSFQQLNNQEKVGLAKNMATNWSVFNGNAPLNSSLQLNGGFNSRLLGKEVGAILALTYNRSFRNLDFANKFFSFDNAKSSLLFDYNSNKYSSDVLWGGMANFSVKLNNNNKISFKNIINVNASDYTTLRTGIDYEQDPTLGENIRARELALKSNTFFNTQLLGEHNLPSLRTKLNWYGSFNILGAYVPQQRRVQYNQSRVTDNEPYRLLISQSKSQKSGSVFYSTLSDYNYNTGVDVTKSFRLFETNQTVKGGYLFQLKDRLFNSRPFSVYLVDGTSPLRLLDEDNVFAPGNFDANDPKKFRFDELIGKQYRYMANTILNAGYLQFDNNFTDWLRVVWGARYEHFDQLVGSTNPEDERYAHSVKADLLPALNIAFKMNPVTNIRLTGSQTVVRPEFRELTNFAFYDFELGAAVIGSSNLQRTKITNVDLRYEIYPRAGELFTVGAFYKNFKNPIELYFNQSGVATNTFNYLNVDKAIGYGVEMEMRKKLDFIRELKNFTLQSNLSFIYNNVKDEGVSINRPMQGQSPYVVNASLQYDLSKYGLTSTLLFNQVGRRILYVGNDVVPAIWENPRPVLDFQITKKVLQQKGEVRLNISDLINRRAYFYHDVDENKKFKMNSMDAIAINRLYGTTVSLTFSYAIK
jgi:outer membrane receptor protein involved in Fe transport